MTIYDALDSDSSSLCHTHMEWRRTGERTLSKGHARKYSNKNRYRGRERKENELNSRTVGRNLIAQSGLEILPLRLAEQVEPM